MTSGQSHDAARHRALARMPARHRSASGVECAGTRAGDPFGFLSDQGGEGGHVLERDTGFLLGQPSLRDPVLHLVGIFN